MTSKEITLLVLHLGIKKRTEETKKGKGEGGQTKRQRQLKGSELMQLSARNLTMD